MIIEDIKDSPIGRLVPIQGYDARFDEDFEHFAYIPDPLPDSVDLAAETWTLIAEAAHQLGRLDEAGQRLPDPTVIRRPQVIKEAQSTSALEGTYVAFTEIVEAELDDLDEADPDMREVLNYIRVAQNATSQIAARDLSVGFLSELQAQLVIGTESDGPDAGKPRTKQVFIGPKSARIVDARFIPPPAGDVLESSYRKWADWVNKDLPNLPPVVQAALAHYQFETLHPYSDGNGRIGRLVILLQLIKAGVIRDALLTVSPWFEDRRRDYQDHLLRVSQTGDFDEWVRFFARALRDQASKTVDKIEALMNLGDRFRRLIQEHGVRGTGRSLAEDLIANPVVTPTSVKDRYSVSYPAANNAVARLTEAGLLREITGRRYDRVFVAIDVIRIAEA